MFKRLVLILFILVVIAGVAAEVILPKIASDAVAQGMSELTGAAQVKAVVQERPAVGMLTGSFDQISIEADNAKMDKLTFSHLAAVLTDVQLDRERLYFRRSVAIEKVKDIDLTATISQDEMARYINQNVKGVKNAAVTIDKGKMQASSSFAFGGIATVAISLEGRIIADGQRIKFVTERFLLNNTPVGNIGDAMLAEIPLVDLKKLPFGVTVREIVLDQGKVTLFTDNRPKSAKKD